MSGCLKLIFLVTFVFLSSFVLVVYAAFGGNLGLTILEMREFCEHAVTTVTGHSWSNVYVFWKNIDIITSLRLLIYVALVYLVYRTIKYIYQFFFKYMDRVRTLGMSGYIHDGTLSPREIANQVRRRRQIGDIPPVYPNGWFGLIESRKLAKRQAVSISALGLNLAVFRDDKGNPHALDAYCPHLGAHLAAGGRVFGNCIECPFHGWRFRGDDGKCVHIPYSDKIPEVARLKSWPIHEANGWVYLWYHAEGIDPTWTIPDIEEIMKGTWVYKGRTEHHVNAHIEEIPLNGADTVHFGQVHGPGIVAGNDLASMNGSIWDFVKHTWKAVWTPQPPPEEHTACLHLKHCLKLFGFSFATLNLDVYAKQIGPGVVYLTFDSLFGKGVYIQSVTPMEPLVLKVIHNIYVNKRIPTILAKFFLLAESIQLERDIMIWNNKQYKKKPVFVKSDEDSLMVKHRRWFSQFYSENSPKMTFQKDTIDW